MLLAPHQAVVSQILLGYFYPVDYLTQCTCSILNSGIAMNITISHGVANFFAESV
jgi:hypothetical protein